MRYVLLLDAVCGHDGSARYFDSTCGHCLDRGLDHQSGSSPDHKFHGRRASGPFDRGVILSGLFDLDHYQEMGLSSVDVRLSVCGKCLYKKPSLIYL